MIARQRRQRGAHDPQGFSAAPVPQTANPETLTPTSYEQGLRAAKKDLYQPSSTPPTSPQQNYPTFYTQSGDYQLDHQVETLSFQSSPNHSVSHNGGLFQPYSEPFPDVEMTCRDRTSEFFRIVEEERLKRQGAGAAHGNRPKPLARRSEFMNIAKSIGVDISNTYAKLEKLTILAKKKSLFDDRPVEIQDLTYIIKQDISSLNKQIAQLQEFSKSRDENSKHAKKHSSSVVVSLQSKLANMSKSFKQVLEIRTENMKHQKQRRDQFSSQPPVVSSALPPRNAQGGALMSATRNSPSPSSGATNGSFMIDMGGDDGAASAAAPSSASSQMQQQMQQLALIDETDSYIQERSDAMQNIESTVVELGQIFTQLATMVKEQEEMIQRIDANVADTELNVEAAHGEILKYFQSVTSNRWLMIKVFLVLIVFFIIFIVFLA